MYSLPMSFPAGGNPVPSEEIDGWDKAVIPAQAGIQ
jgi:hypothetical protein